MTFSRPPPPQVRGRGPETRSPGRGGGVPLRQRLLLRHRTIHETLRSQYSHAGNDTAAAMSFRGGTIN